MVVATEMVLWMVELEVITGNMEELVSTGNSVVVVVRMTAGGRSIVDESHLRKVHPGGNILHDKLQANYRQTIDNNVIVASTHNIYA